MSKIYFSIIFYNYLERKNFSVQVSEFSDTSIGIFNNFKLKINKCSLKFTNM